MTIYYTMMRDKNTKKLISSESSKQTSNVKIENALLKELRDTIPDTQLYKTQSSTNSKFYLVFCAIDRVSYSVVVDKYEENGNIVDYIHALDKEYKTKNNWKNYEFDTIVKNTSSDFNKDKTKKIVDETKDIMVDACNLITQRKENIDQLSKCVNDLAVKTKQMNISIRKMQFSNSVYNYGYYAIIMAVLLLLLYFIIH